MPLYPRQRRGLSSSPSDRYSLAHRELRRCQDSFCCVVAAGTRVLDKDICPYFSVGFVLVGFRTATDRCEIVAPSTGVRLTWASSQSTITSDVAGGHHFQLSRFQFLHHTNLTICLYCNFTCRAVKSCLTVWVQRCSLHGWDRSYTAVARDPMSARKTFSMEQGVPLKLSMFVKEHDLYIAIFVAHIFSGTDLNVADQRDITSQSWQLSCMHFLSLACYFICIFQSLFCGIISILPSWTEPQFILCCLFHLFILCGVTGIAQLGIQA